MGWKNPPIPWAELERRLSDRHPLPERSQEREVSRPRSIGPVEQTSSPYIELHCHSNFSFLDGASYPEELALEAAKQGLEAMALTDHDGLYGVVRFAEAAAEVGLGTLFGAELSLELTKHQSGMADPEGRHLLVIARNLEGYHRLSRAISTAQLKGKEKGKPVYQLEQLGEAHNGHWLVLTGCRKGLVPTALNQSGIVSASDEIDRLIGLFGRDNVAVELWDHGDPLDSHRNHALAELAKQHMLPLVASNNVHFATPVASRRAAALAAVRARRSLDDLDGWFHPAGAAYVRSGAEMARRFNNFPQILDTTVRLGRECVFDLKLIAPNLPNFAVPLGHTEMSWLRHLTEKGAVDRYGPRESERSTGAYSQLDHELRVIEELEFPGYFLIVWDIVKFCRQQDIFCQGRGSAANSAVCYALGITNVNSVEFGLLFERFLSPAREGPPDIDLDIESDRREEVIQYVYAKYGRMQAAQVANVITYRPRLAIRDMAKVLGYSADQQDSWARQVNRYSSIDTDEINDIPQDVVHLARQVQGFPRHLGIHSGGMVICDRSVTEVCPVEWARMPGRTVLQWDKDDCAAINLVKFDLLGLGMLSALHYAIDFIEQHHNIRVDLAKLPQEKAVYDMLCEADTIGVFQVESRAQMATLPRLRPQRFYDLVIEVAIIRPGPIQGGSVHPFIRRHSGREEITYLHPLLEPALKKTKGVPLFQEQLMQIAVDVAGFTAAESDLLRQALSSRRSSERLAKLRPRLFSGMAEKGISQEVAEQIYAKLIAFSDFGFPESHAVSFAYLVYASAWIKLHYPAAFCAALLNAQPMGFYSPQSLVADARRHGVIVRRPDINTSLEKATLESGESPDKPAVRLGLTAVRKVGTELAEKLVAGQPYADLTDLVLRHSLSRTVVESLATAGALEGLGVDRRQALWMAGEVTRYELNQLVDTSHISVPKLPPMTEQDKAIADIWATGISSDSYPTQFMRTRLTELGVLTSTELCLTNPGEVVLTAGIVTHRQQPSTAGGVVFLSLEDEKGQINVICSPSIFRKYRRNIRESPALFVRGRLERSEGVTNVIAHRVAPLHIAISSRSRDFR